MHECIVVILAWAVRSSVAAVICLRGDDDEMLVEGFHASVEGVIRVDADTL